mmetsp:Transcript_10890/g.31229  ORF Transcript_10890/g.31229 Transcript_10890/m.31229 type:complete len:392 (+) Transcript_10890:1104-2279(+)
MASSVGADGSVGLSSFAVSFWGWLSAAFVGEETFSSGPSSCSSSLSSAPIFASSFGFPSSLAGASAEASAAASSLLDTFVSLASGLAFSSLSSPLMMTSVAAGVSSSTVSFFSLFAPLPSSSSLPPSCSSMVASSLGSSSSFFVSLLEVVSAGSSAFNASGDLSSPPSSIFTSTSFLSASLASPPSSVAFFLFANLFAFVVVSLFTFRLGFASDLLVGTLCAVLRLLFVALFLFLLQTTQAASLESVHAVGQTEVLEGWLVGNAGKQGRLPSLEFHLLFLRSHAVVSCPDTGSKLDRRVICFEVGFVDHVPRLVGCWVPLLLVRIVVFFEEFVGLPQLFGLWRDELQRFQNVDAVVFGFWSRRRSHFLCRCIGRFGLGILSILSIGCTRNR